MSDRDVLLGRALDALAVPEHRPGFALPQRRAPILPLAGALAAAAIVAVALVLVTSLRTQTASAADVLRAVAKALQTTHSVSGTVVGSNYRYTVVVARDGSYLSRGIGFATAYDAAAHRAESWSRTGGLYNLRRPDTYENWRNVDPGLLSFALNQNGYALSLHSALALALEKAHVTNTRYAGRAAWRLDLHLSPGRPGFIGNGYRLVLVIDRQTGFVLSLSRYLTTASEPTSTIRLEDLRIDVPTPRSLFHVTPPRNVHRVNADWRFRAVTPAQVRSVVGYRPLLPSDTRGLSRIALAASPLTGTSVPSLVGAPPVPVRRDVVSAVYGNGFAAAITYSTRRYDASEGMPPSADINTVTSIQFAAPRPVRLIHGAFAGRQAWISASPVQSTFLWVAKGDLVARIVSTLPAADVLAVANSIAPA
jgi:outer membrane lipoprotein-sorting protein